MSQVSACESLLSMLATASFHPCQGLTPHSTGRLAAPVNSNVKAQAVALDIGLRKTGSSYEHRFSLPADEHYWFMHPWFKEVHKTCGIYVDLYGDAEFHSGKGLGVLESKLRAALAAAENSPPTWQVHVGTQLRPEKKELYMQVVREEVVQTISNFLVVLQEVKETDATIVCNGD
jgi:hypothetical protein